MRKTLLLLLALLLVPTVSLMGQTYSSLWKQVNDAADKDLPQTKIGVLRQIERKAETEKDYGQLLKASLMDMQTVTDLSADSLRPAVERLQQKEHKTSDALLKAVYNVVLYHIYRDNTQLCDDDTASLTKAEQYRINAMTDMNRLAATKTSAYVPFVVKGSDSDRMFDDDMLSVIGYETGFYKQIADHYYKKGNRRAACLAAVEHVKRMAPAGAEDFRKSEQIHRLDSIIALFGDLDVAGEAAVERYNYMERCQGVTVEDKISYIHYALGRWGGWVRSNELRNAERTLTTPQYAFSLSKRCVAPNEQQTVTLENLRNIRSLTMKVYSTPLDGSTTFNQHSDQDFQKLKKDLTLMPEQTQTLTFLGKADYQLFNDSLTIGSLPSGVYMLEFETSPATETKRRLYFVSDIYAVGLPLPNNTIRYAVVSATTGQPISGASLRLTCNRGYNKQVKTVSLTCDRQGEATYTYKDNERPDDLFAYTATDKAAPRFYTYGSYYWDDDNSEAKRTEIFTDKAIYRPGQTVHMATITYKNTGGNDNNTMEGHSVSARLIDANGKTVGEKTLTTDKYGTCSADFTLPQSGLTGVYTLLADGHSTSFRVEEYKRPTFQVEFPTINQRYQEGDTLTVTAKAASYAGVPVGQAKVKYTVKRRVAFWWLACGRYWGRSAVSISQGDETLYEGETSTADDGTFSVSMPLSLPDGAKGTRMFYNFTVSADVTNASGETHNGSMSVPLGTRATAFSSDLPDKVLADSLRQLTFHLRNAAGLPINATVNYYIDDASAMKTGQTEEPCPVEGKLISGRHRLVAVCDGDTITHDFVAFSLNDTRPCTDTDDWFYVSADRFAQNGQPVTVQAGASAKGLHIIYVVSAGDKVLESGTADKDNELINRKFNYKDDYGDGLLLAYAWVKNGRLYSHKATIARPQPDKRLKLSWTSFRDRLTPGQKEEWTLKISKPDGHPADAQLLATLYDKSLDQISKHSWSFLPINRLHLPDTQWLYGMSSSIRGNGVLSQSFLAERQLDLSHFDSDLWPSYSPFRSFGNGHSPILRVRGGARLLMATAHTDAAPIMEAKMAAVGNDVEESAMADGDTQDIHADVQVRENMNETALFQPSLTANKDGEVTLSFTLPESLTTWHFMGLAHTQDMCYGLIESETVANKEFMVQPNIPRFLRMGDAAVLKASVFNTTSAAISGSARMEMIDPETEKVVRSETVAFNVDKDKTATVSFNYTPDGNLSLLICRITAVGNGFSDGEQHYIPVLPDRESVTVTVPFTQHAAGTKTIDMAKLFPNETKQQKLTIEYANNPAWMVVQALPALATAESENAIDQCAAIYSNTLGKAIVDGSPKIKSVFEIWKREQDGGSSLTSSLSKNQELKDIVLGETPWVAEADKETEQKARLADFFDATANESRRIAATQKLSSLQNADGSWSWWPGMRGSVSMTVCISEMLVRLNSTVGRQQATATMLSKAFDFMDKQTVEMVQRMRNEERKGHKQTFPGFTTLQYLYLRSMDNRKQSADVQSACDYLVGLMKKENRSENILEKALSAIILAKHGEKTKSLEYAQSLKEYSVCTEEAGRYYDTYRATYSWCAYKIPTEVAAIEALKTVTPADTLTIDEMRRWLLHEKRTQMWDTPINSINAVYAFLLNNVGVLASGEHATIAIDGSSVELPAATAGVGYVKTAITQPKGRQLTFTKTSSGTSWGAAYAQYLQRTSDIEQHESGISVKRELLGNHKTLKMGDRIKVRITIEAKRDFDFVQVIDRRAACMEPVRQTSGWSNGAYCTPKDNSTNYYFDMLTKGRHVLETEYYIDREGKYETGTCIVGCAYAPEYRGTAKSMTLTVDGQK